MALLFLLNAATYANVVPRVPAIKAELDLSNTSLGTAVAAMPVGALLAGPFAGPLITRLGSARVAVGCGVAFGLVLPGFALASSWPELAAVFLVLGVLDSWMDVAMNAHALRVQRGFGRSIINRLHGVWSIGAAVGGVGGAVAAATHASMTVHLVVAGVVVSVTAISINGWLMPGPDEGEREPVPGGAGAGPAGRRGRRHPTARRFVLLGIIVVMSAAIEDAPQSWGAILLRDELGTSAAAAGSVYIAFQVSMTVARLLGDRLVDRVGEVAIVRAGGVLTAGAVAASLAIGTPTAVVVGFALAGFGTAPLFPVVFHAAGNVPGVATGYGVAFAAWMGRLGFLAAPPLVGLVGDALNLRIGLAVVPAAGVVVALLASSTAGAQPDGRSHK